MLADTVPTPPLGQGVYYVTPVIRSYLHAGPSPVRAVS